MTQLTERQRLTKPYKEHLREQLTTPDDYRGYLDACHAEGSETFALAVQDVLEFATTAMHDKCVEKVKVMGQQWQDQRLREKRDLMEHAAMMCGTKAEAAYEITRVLESLTLDQVKPGEV